MSSSRWNPALLGLIASIVLGYQGICLGDDGPTFGVGDRVRRANKSFQPESRG